MWFCFCILYFALLVCLSIPATIPHSPKFNSFTSHCIYEGYCPNFIILQEWTKGFPGVPVIKNPPATAGNTGLSLIQKIPHAEEQVSLCVWAHATTPEPMQPSAHAPQQEKPPQWGALTLQLGNSPHSPQLERNLHSSEDPAQPKPKSGPIVRPLLSRCHVQLFAAPWTVAHQAPPSMEFSRQENWSGLPFPT